MKRYLIAQYFPAAGQDEEHPDCYFGTGSYVLSAELPVYINERHCYKTLAQANRYAAKCNMAYMYSRFAVKTVTLTDNGMLQQIA